MEELSGFLKLLNCFSAGNTLAGGFVAVHLFLVGMVCLTKIYSDIFHPIRKQYRVAFPLYFSIGSILLIAWCVASLFSIAFLAGNALSPLVNVSISSLITGTLIFGRIIFLHSFDIKVHRHYQNPNFIVFSNNLYLTQTFPYLLISIINNTILAMIGIFSFGLLFSFLVNNYLTCM